MVEIELKSNNIGEMYQQLKVYKHAEPESDYYAKISARLMLLILEEVFK